MNCDVGEVTESLVNQNELWRRWSDWKLGEWASVTSPTSQLILILQAFHHFTYITAHSDSPSFPSSQLILQPFFCFSYVTGFSLHHLASCPWCVCLHVAPPIPLLLICNLTTDRGEQQHTEGKIGSYWHKPISIFFYWASKEVLTLVIFIVCILKSIFCYYNFSFKENIVIWTYCINTFPKSGKVWINIIIKTQETTTDKYELTKINEI